MSNTKRKNSIWSFLFLLPIAASALVTIGGLFTVIGIACLAIDIILFLGSQKAYNAGNGDNWWQYLLPVLKNRQSNQSPTTPINPPNPPNPINPPPIPVSQNVSIWNQQAPAFSKERLSATVESLKWGSNEVDALAKEAGEQLQYGLAFRYRAGNEMVHSQRLATIQMSEIAESLKRSLPQGTVCRAWPLYELSKGSSMDGLLVVPDRNRPLGLYLILMGNQTKSRFVVLSMFIPVCSQKAAWIKTIHQPSSSDLNIENEMITRILQVAEHTL